jgi:hypothetical protein
MCYRFIRIITKNARDIPPKILHRNKTVVRSISLPEAFPQPIAAREPITPKATSISTNGQNAPGLSVISSSYFLCDAGNLTEVKARVNIAAFTARLKPCPFKTWTIAEIL